MIQPGQKLKEGDCVYGISIKQSKSILSISGDDWTASHIFDSWVFNGGKLYPTYLEYCSELEEYNFADFKKLCENTFGDGSV